MATFSDVLAAWKSVTPEDAPLAARFFAAELEQMRLESDVHDLLEAAFGEGAVDEFTADYYDESVEVYLVNRDLSKGDLTPLWAAGFKRAWIHSIADGCLAPNRGRSGDRCDCRCQVPTEVE